MQTFKLPAIFEGIIPNTVQGLVSFVVAASLAGAAMASVYLHDQKPDVLTIRAPLLVDGDDPTIGGAPVISIKRFAEMPDESRRAYVAGLINGLAIYDPAIKDCYDKWYAENSRTDMEDFVKRALTLSEDSQPDYVKNHYYPPAFQVWRMSYMRCVGMPPF